MNDKREFIGFYPKQLPALIDIIQDLRDEMYPEINKYEWFIEINLDTESTCCLSIQHTSHLSKSLTRLGVVFRNSTIKELAYAYQSYL